MCGTSCACGSLFSFSHLFSPLRCVVLGDGGDGCGCQRCSHALVCREITISVRLVPLTSVFCCAEQPIANVCAQPRRTKMRIETRTDSLHLTKKVCIKPGMHIPGYPPLLSTYRVCIRIYASIYTLIQTCSGSCLKINSHVALLVTGVISFFLLTLYTNTFRHKKN